MARTATTREGSGSNDIGGFGASQHNAELMSLMIPDVMRQSRVARCIQHKQINSQTLQLPTYMTKSRLGRATSDCLYQYRDDPESCLNKLPSNMRHSVAGRSLEKKQVPACMANSMFGRAVTMASTPREETRSTARPPRTHSIGTAATVLEEDEADFM
jgi:hypothetical protein